MTALGKRECGACNACCVSLKLASPELRKKAGTPCRHLNSAGCGIYQDRPGVCARFLCGWRLFEELDDSWRPDLSGVLITRKAPAELPLQWRSAPYGVRMDIIAGEAAILRRSFAAYALRLMKQDIAVFLSAASPAILLNEHLGPSEVRDPLIFSEKLRTLYAQLHAARWERGILRMIPPLYRLQLNRWRSKIPPT